VDTERVDVVATIKTEAKSGTLERNTMKHIRIMAGILGLVLLAAPLQAAVQPPNIILFFLRQYTIQSWS